MQDVWRYRIPGEYASGFGHRLGRLCVKAPRQSHTWRHDLLRSSAAALSRRDCSSSPQEHGSSLASASAHGTLLFRLRPRAIRPSSHWQSQRHPLGHCARRGTLFFQKIPPISHHNWSHQSRTRNRHQTSTCTSVNITATHRSCPLDQPPPCPEGEGREEGMGVC